MPFLWRRRDSGPGILARRGLGDLEPVLTGQAGAGQVAGASKPGAATQQPQFFHQTEIRQDMLDSGVTIGSVTHAIQLALAPVFLLTGIAGVLNLMAGRLARIIDRGRMLTEHPLSEEHQRMATVQVERECLDHRRYLASAAITACTFSALLVCLVIAAIFLEVLLQIQLKWFIGTLFTASTLALVVGLSFFLREVHLATRTIRIPVSGSDRVAP